ncbi:sensor histidine kinase [Rhodoferax sp. U2-2l]|uniref:ATP-binding protein n=1 Tax=Rhodoferax sp. U2-2l TaxID=2884000 RepID=UPI001D0A7ABB|nr:sensor histidine kinase [Rhodoferax sp. U2-2l]MCB8745647.1 sensor histidine kinase [Rhodoferax sp. U2-2l]
MSLLKLRSSLRMRLLVGTLFWIVASVLVAGWGLSGLFHQHVQAQFQAELTSHLDQLTAQFTLDEQNQPKLQIALSDPRLTRPFSGYYWQIDRVGPTLASGKVDANPLRSRSLWDHVLVLPAPTAADGKIHVVRIAGPQGQWLSAVVRSVQVERQQGEPATSFRLMAAADERFMLEPVAQFSGTMWLALAALAGGLVVAAVVQVLVGLAPLRALRHALGRVRSAETQLLEGDFPLEVMPLIDDFNNVLVQNAEVVERARTHAGNLAHALKTPLSVLANAAQANKDAPRPASELAHLVTEQVAIARQQVNYHLTRAQAAATSRMPGAKTAVLPVVDGLVRVMRRIHAERNLALTLQPIPETLAFRGETQDLQEMLGNVLDNACKWATHQVTLSAQSQARNVIITVDDDGPGLPPDQREAVRQRGVRADEQVPGSGLGLAIVDDLARLYGGKVTLMDSHLGGLRAVLMLPAA